MPPDVQMGGDPITKAMTFHVSMWFAPVIAQPARYFIAADVIISGYNGGMGVRPYTPESWSPADFVTSGGDENGNDASVFALLNPYGSLRHISDVIDIRGHFDAELLQVARCARTAWNQTYAHAGSAVGVAPRWQRPVQAALSVGAILQCAVPLQRPAHAERGRG